MWSQARRAINAHDVSVARAAPVACQARCFAFSFPVDHPPACPQVRWVVNAHDFSGARAALVASVPGLHHGPDECGFGHLRMRALLNQVGLRPET